MGLSEHMMESKADQGSPVDLDIFSAFSRRWPLVRMERGHLLGSFCQIAVWLYSAKLR